jgi:hypothetical protein
MLAAVGQFGILAACALLTAVVDFRALLGPFWVKAICASAQLGAFFTFMHIFHAIKKQREWFMIEVPVDTLHRPKNKRFATETMSVEEYDLAQLRRLMSGTLGVGIVGCIVFMSLDSASALITAAWLNAWQVSQHPLTSIYVYEVPPQGNLQRPWDEANPVRLLLRLLANRFLSATTDATGGDKRMSRSESKRPKHSKKGGR